MDWRDVLVFVVFVGMCAALVVLGLVSLPPTPAKVKRKSRSR